jgi:DNA-binding PadR family transcriptional regulator
MKGRGAKRGEIRDAVAHVLWLHRLVKQTKPRQPPLSLHDIRAHINEKYPRLSCSNQGIHAALASLRKRGWVRVLPQRPKRRRRRPRGRPAHLYEITDEGCAYVLKPVLSLVLDGIEEAFSPSAKGRSPTKEEAAKLVWVLGSTWPIRGKGDAFVIPEQHARGKALEQWKEVSRNWEKVLSTNDPDHTGWRAYALLGALYNLLVLLSASRPVRITLQKVVDASRPSRYAKRLVAPFVTLLDELPRELTRGAAALRRS